MSQLHLPAAPALRGRPVLLLLARPPVPGRVKTRLIPLLGEAGACELYSAFVRDTLRWAWQGARDLDMALAVAWAGEPPVGLAIPFPAIVLRQRGRNLGERQARAHQVLAAAGAGPVLMLGADSPTLPMDRLSQSLACLRREPDPPDAAVVPAADGGYVLLGLRRPRPGLLAGIPWGTPQVLSILEARAAKLRLRLARLAGWYDVDDGAGLARLRRSLEEGGGTAAPDTAAVLQRRTAARPA